MLHSRWTLMIALLTAVASDGQAVSAADCSCAGGGARVAGGSAMQSRDPAVVTLAARARAIAALNATRGGLQFEIQSRAVSGPTGLPPSGSRAFGVAGGDEMDSVREALAAIERSRTGSSALDNPRTRAGATRNPAIWIPLAAKVAGQVLQSLTQNSNSLSDDALWQNLVGAALGAIPSELGISDPQVGANLASTVVNLIFGNQGQQTDAQIAQTVIAALADILKAHPAAASNEVAAQSPDTFGDTAAKLAEQMLARAELLDRQQQQLDAERKAFNELLAKLGQAMIDKANRPAPAAPASTPMPDPNARSRGR